MKAGLLRTLLSREILDIARDRKALAAALLVPLLLYPVLRIFAGRFLSPRPLPRGPHGVVTALAEELKGLGPFLVEEGFLLEPGAPATARAVEDGAVDLALSPGGKPGEILAFLAPSAGPASRVRARLERALTRRRGLDLLQAARGRPALRAALDRFRLEEVTLPAEERSNPAGILLAPLALLLVLLSGSAFAALDLLPGEKERGTLETLLVQPVSTAEVVLAKYLALLLPGLAALLLGILSIAATPLLPGGGDGGFASAGEAALVFLLSLPAALLLAAVLFWTAALARSFREGQHYLLPLTLGILIPAGLALSPALRPGPFTASLPILGAVLAWRAALEGKLELLPAAGLFLSHLAWTALVLAHARRLLEREEIRLAFDPASLLDRRHRPPGRRALYMGVLLVFGILVFPPFLQAALGPAALPLSLVLLVLLPALALPRLLGLPWERAFPLAPPRPGNGAALLAAAAGLVFFSSGYVPLQDAWLPLPPEVLQGIERALAPAERSGTALLLLEGAFLPALCEEALFRGPLLFSFRAQWGERRALLLSSLLFAGAHLSVHRFLPTLAAGLVFGGLALRTRNLLWPFLCHFLYNGTLLFLSRGIPEGTAWTRLFAPDPGAALLRAGAGACLVAVGLLLALKEGPRPRLFPGKAPLGR